MEDTSTENNVTFKRYDRNLHFCPALIWSELEYTHSCRLVGENPHWNNDNNARVLKIECRERVSSYAYFSSKAEQIEEELVSFYYMETAVRKKGKKSLLLDRIGINGLKYQGDFG